MEMILTVISCTLVFLIIFLYLLIDARCFIFMTYFSREYIDKTIYADLEKSIVDNLQSFIYSCY